MLANFLQHKQLDVIYSSPWYRCVQTSNEIAKKLHLPIEIEPGIAEFFLTVTPGTGLHPFPDLNTLNQLFPAVAGKHKPLVFPSRAGETTEELFDRIGTTMDRLLEELDGRDDAPQTILLVGHAATVVPIGRCLVGDAELEIRTGCCSMSKYVREGDGRLGSWTCEYSGRSDYLENGEERHWAFEDIVGQEFEDGVGELKTKL
jgi:transcription factor C subunit 7